MADSTRDSVSLHPPMRRDEAEFLRAVHRSRRLHKPWGYPPSDPPAYRFYLRRQRSDRYEGFLLRAGESSELVGVVNLNEITRGALQSAYLGFYALVPFQGQGLMRRGLRRVLRYAFSSLKLHRLEANIQPENEPSLRLVRRLGFEREGFSPRYLKIAGRWRDHERWAIRAETRIR